MLAAIRAFAKSWVAVILFAVLIFSFALFGIRDVFNRGSVSDAVVTAGPRSINSIEYKREYDNYKAEAEQQYGQPISPQMAVDGGLVSKILDTLATREAFAALLDKIGLHASDKLVAGEIGKIQAFFNPVSGQFDKQQYQRRLADNGLTPDRFEGVMRDQLAQQHLITALGNGLEAPRAYSAMAAVYELESRDLAYFTVDPSKVPPVAQPTDAELTAFIKQNAAQLTRPEFRQLTVVHFGPELIKTPPAVDEAQLHQLYDYRKDTLSSPETRTIVQIPAKDAAAARKIGEALAAGQSPQAAAKSVGAEAITYDAKPQSAIPDHRVGEAAFKMQVGQAAPVQGELGLAVVKIVAVQPGHAVTFEQARPALETELRNKAIQQQVYDLSQAYDDAHSKGATLAEAAQKAGVPTVPVGPISKQGADLQGRPAQGLPPKLLDTAFGLPAGGESDIVEARQGEYFAVRVDKVIPPALPALDEIRPQLTRFWMMREMAKRLEAKANDLAARVKKGESLEAVAASAGASVSRVPGLSRQTAGQTPGVSQEMLGHAFTAKPGDVFTAQAAGFAYVVGKLEAVHAGDPTQLAQAALQARAPMTDTLFRELGESARTYAKVKMKVKVNAERAAEIIGVQPAAKDKGKAAGPAGLAK